MTICSYTIKDAVIAGQPGLILKESGSRTPLVMAQDNSPRAVASILRDLARYAIERAEALETKEVKRK